MDVYHSALCIIVQYVIFLILGGSLLSVLTSFAFQLVRKCVEILKLKIVQFVDTKLKLPFLY